MTHPKPSSESRITQLDGWRGISILLVLAAHLLPLGPSAWELNYAAGLAGMSLFFSLSGFLITSFLLHRPDPKSFLIRRALRIVPLAWLVLFAAALVEAGTLQSLGLRLAFVQSYFTGAITPATSHYWSLGVETHFYLFVAVLVFVGGRRALFFLPLVALFVTGLRIHDHAYADIKTHLRVDEILSGASLALALENPGASAFLRRHAQALFAVAVPLWLGSCHPITGPLAYLRPYVAALVVGSSLGFTATSRVHRLLSSPRLGYVAEISYALYVLHGPLRTGWFASGSSAERYLFKRPITFFLTFSLAHLSTRYFESRFIQLARRWTTPRASTRNLHVRPDQPASP